jgi:hypothetical protein
MDLNHLLDTRILNYINHVLFQESRDVRRDFAEFLMQIRQEEMLADYGLLQGINGDSLSVA